MRTLSLILLYGLSIILLPQKSEAQAGLNFDYQVNQNHGWLQAAPAESIRSEGYKIGLDYWFRLKRKRIEFTPALSYAFHESGTGPDVPGLRVNWLTGQFHTQLYIFDWANDCNCPTFSKQNDFFKKGFFLRLSPGLTVLRSPTRDDGSPVWGKVQALLGLGAGFDVGLSDFLTISPVFQFNYLPRLEWPSMASTSMAGPVAPFWQFSPALRLGFRFDH